MKIDFQPPKKLKYFSQFGEVIQTFGFTSVQEPAKLTDDVKQRKQNILNNTVKQNKS